MSYVINIASYKRQNKGKGHDPKWYYQELDRILDELFEDAVNMGYTNWNRIAEASGLTHTCVANLGERITKRPQLRTVLMLASAVNKTVVFKATEKPKTKLKLRRKHICKETQHNIRNYLGEIRVS